MSLPTPSGTKTCLAGPPSIAVVVPDFQLRASEPGQVYELGEAHLGRVLRREADPGERAVVLATVPAALGQEERVVHRGRD